MVVGERLVGESPAALGKEGLEEESVWGVNGGRLSYILVCMW